MKMKLGKCHLHEGYSQKPNTVMGSITLKTMIEKKINNTVTTVGVTLNSKRPHTTTVVKNVAPKG